MVPGAAFPNSPWYNVDLVFRLDLDPGDRLNIDAMRRALAEIVSRHEALRASFPVSDGQPVQAIHPEVEIPFPVIDLAGVPESQRESEMMRIAMEEAQRPFALARPPLLRTSLLRMGERYFVFLLTVHHIIADGWSMSIFSDELTCLYEAFRNGLPSPLPEVSFQFSDFVQWQRRRLDSAEAAVQLEWWKRRLEGAPSLALGTDRPRPAVPSYRGARQSISISQSLMHRLEALSRREENTLFVTLLAAFQTLLHRYTGQPEIVVGTPVARQSGQVRIAHRLSHEHPGDADRSLGQPHIPRSPGPDQGNRGGGTGTPGCAVRENRRGTQYPPGPDPQSSLPGYVPTFQAPGPSARGAKPLVTQKGTTQMDLAIDLFQSHAGLSGTIEYSTDLFDHSTIERMLGHFQVLLEGIADDPGRCSIRPAAAHPPGTAPIAHRMEHIPHSR